MARAGGGAIGIRGLTELRRDLKALDKTWPKELTKLNREVGNVAAEWARGGAAASGGVVAAAAYSIVGAGTQTGARIRWGGSGYEYADGAFFGSLRYQQFRPWIGASWSLGEGGEGPGSGPYGINPAISARRDEIGEMYLARLEELAARAFS